MTVAAPEVVRVTLSRPQHSVYRERKRFRTLIAGRRFGKSYLAGVEELRVGMEAPGRLVWGIAPTYKMVKEISWWTLKRLAKPWAAKMNETDLSIDLVNGSRIQLHGADNPNRLVGRGIDFAVIDEFALVKSELWDEIIRPALADREGGALFISTPRGFNWAYEFYERGLADDPKWHDWASWQYRTVDGGRVSEAELLEARATMDPRLFRQEFEASFETLLGRVYDQFDRTHNRLPEDFVDPGGELLVGMDFNVHPMSAVVAVKAGDQCLVVDELSIPTSNTEEMAQELKQRYPQRRLIICPDPSGRARKTSAPVGQTDFTILQRHGFVVQAGNVAPLIVDRVNNVQANLCDAAGNRHLFVHDRCKELRKALLGLTYKDGTNLPDKDSGLDHITDALGYLCWERFPRLRPRTTIHRNPL